LSERWAGPGFLDVDFTDRPAISKLILPCFGRSGAGSLPAGLDKLAAPKAAPERTAQDYKIIRPTFSRNCE